jgi:hypothetical protein
MESRSNAAAAREGLGTPPMVVQAARQRRAAMARQELQIGTSRRTNLLIVGPPSSTRVVLDMLRLDLAGPVFLWHPGQPLVLPRPDRVATLVIDQPLSLTREEQLRLVSWLLEVIGQVRVVSTSAAPLWPSVQSGHFDETLYYRLNPICLETDQSLITNP